MSVLYVNSAQEIWKELKERFSQTNEPRIYQLQKSISSLQQEQLSVSFYYTQLKGFWDELMNYRPLPVCTYGALKTLADIQQQNYIIQFLMGLNDSYSHI